MPPSHFADAYFFPPRGPRSRLPPILASVFLLVARSSITGAAMTSYWEKSSTYQTAVSSLHNAGRLSAE